MLPQAVSLQDAGGDDLNAKRAYKAKFQEGIALFNKKPKKGEYAIALQIRSVCVAA